MKLLSPALWLKQAKADRKASKAKDIDECHRRYLLQQAYEKAVKALALASLTSKQTADKQFASALGDSFLHHHTPLTVLSSKDEAVWEEELKRSYARNWQTIHHKLKALRTELRRHMEAGTDRKIVKAWEQIDGTRPNRSVEEVSYRYPFLRGTTELAPCQWDGWSTYQGNEAQVRIAVDELVDRAARQVAVWEAQADK